MGGVNSLKVMGEASSLLSVFLRQWRVVGEEVVRQGEMFLGHFVVAAMDGVVRPLEQAAFGVLRRS